MKNLSAKWQKIVIWLTGYLNLIAFFIAGGFIYNKTEDEDVKKSAKTVLLFTLAFTALEIIYLIIYNFMGIGDASYDDLNGFSKFMLFVEIIKAVVFVTFGVLDFFGIKVIPVDFIDGKKNKDDNDQENTDQDQQ